jgi:hypothetical protein
MDIAPTTLRDMASLGFLAATQGRAHDAERIFQGLAAIRPEHEATLLGLALVRLNTGHHQEALEILQDKAGPLHPDSENLRCFTALALHRVSRTDEARAMLEQVRDTGKDPVAMRLAENLMQDLF